MTQKDTLQHFDAGNEDFEWALHFNRMCLELFGGWPIHGKESRWKSLRHLSMLILYVCGECLPCTYALVRVQNFMNLAIDNIFFTTGSWLSTFKIFRLWYCRSIFAQLLKWTKRDWSRCNSEEDWAREVMLKHARRGRMLSVFSYGITMLHVVLLSLSTVFDLNMRIVNNITDPDPRRRMPLQSYYPYNFTKSPNYEITYVYQLMCATYASLAYVTADTFFAALVFHATGQIEILTAKMRRLCDPPGQGLQRQSFQQRARQLIDNHTRLVGFVDAINDSFGFLVFAQVFGSMSLICTACYGLINALDEAPPSQQAGLILAVVHVNEHIFIYCLTCEILASNSEQMFDSIYNSNWYELPPNEARYIIIMLARAQYPLQVTAGNFFILSLNAYVQIVKSIGSYVSMLLAVS